MICRRVKKRERGELHKDYPCHRITAFKGTEETSVHLVGGKYNDKVMTLKPGSLDLLVTIHQGRTVEVYHEPGFYEDD